MTYLESYIERLLRTHIRPWPEDTAYDHPVILSGSDFICACIPHPDHPLLLGPFCKAEHLFFRYSLEQETPFAHLFAGEKDLPDVPLSALADAMLLLYYEQQDSDTALLTPEDILRECCTQTEHADVVWEKYNALLFANLENGIIHNPYNQEIREYSAVENGDVDEVLRIQQEDYTERNGTLAFDPIRQEINLGIVVTTLARSAAARGGVSPEACYSLSDVTIQEMENSHDIRTIRHIYRSSEVRYTELVREQKNRHGSQEESQADNLHIQHCKDYIFTHLHSKITVQQIADAIGLEANYLSVLFKKHEHTTLKQYILVEKIRLVKNMLAYSPYSYVEIANYLGFSSQSHLGDQFKKVTGMTMRHYRLRHGKEDFLQEVAENE